MNHYRVFSDSKNSRDIRGHFTLTLPPNENRIGEGGKRTKPQDHCSMDGNKPLVSIITVVLNGATHLEQTIHSVFEQSHEYLEYIIIDGGSTDGTLDIIKKYEEKLEYWVSEADNGVSEAFNKGITLTRGDFIQVLNADDWLSPDQIETAVGGIYNKDCDYVYGDLIFHDGFSKPLFLYKGKAGYDRSIRRTMPRLNHPTVLAKSEMYKNIGGFDSDYKLAMDYEWLLRAHVSGYRGKYIPGLVGHMRRAGLSDKKFLEAQREVLHISMKYGYPPYLAYPYYLYRVFRGSAGKLIEDVLPFGIGKKIVGSLKRYL